MTAPTAARDKTARSTAAAISGRRIRADVMDVTLTAVPRPRLKSGISLPVRITLKEQTNMDQAVIP
jgi:hypothetical protein